ncbi:MAG: hypothetical protein P1Q69_09990 [Candidatus Thorarchaeota archaeon]|nr:hypothetical protein [Candidatus Thorarchaeota archaeon]
MQDVVLEFVPPDEPLEIIKAFLDLSTVIAFVIVLIVILIAKNRYPMMERRRTFWPLIIFAIFGIISMGMDAFDEWFWFTPKAFYDFVWKPTRLLLFLAGIFILVFAFLQFYNFSERLFGEETNE